MTEKDRFLPRYLIGYQLFAHESICWRNVPVPVWEYMIGGYQVIKKWLSYREKPLLGRGLTIAEVRYVTENARRIAALLALQPQLDEIYSAVTNNATASTNPVSM